jgi:hypothetical protein
LPEIDASVSTRVVSWNDAAEMNESVESDAFVIPSSTGRPVAGRPPAAITPAVGDLEPRAVDDRVALAVAPLRVLHDERPGAVHDDALAGVVVPLPLGLDDLEALVADRAGVLGVERGLLRHARRRAADVERPHRQLRARLADRLRGR